MVVNDIEGEKGEVKRTQKQKGTTPCHNASEQGAYEGANNTKKKYSIDKEKGFHAPRTVPLIMSGSEQRLS